MKLRIFLVAAILSVCHAAPCSAQTIHVRVVNRKTGRSLPAQRVEVALLYSCPENAHPQQNQYVTLTTDANGAAQFELPSPPPAWISAQPQLDDNRWLFEWLMFRTDDLLKTGIVSTTRNRVNAPGRKTNAARNRFLRRADDALAASDFPADAGLAAPRIAGVHR